MKKKDKTAPEETPLIEVGGSEENAPETEATEAGEERESGEAVVETIGAPAERETLPDADAEGEKEPAGAPQAEPSATEPEVETIGTPAEGEPTPEADFEDEGEEAEGAGSIFDSELMRLMNTPEGLKSAIESLLFVSPEPLTPHRIARTLEIGDIKLVTTALTNMRLEYDEHKRGMQILETAEGYQMATREVFGDLILRLKNRKRRPALSQAALETLAIIAYRQPIIRADVEAVRGVESSGTIRNLIDMGLVEMVGRKEVLGRPPMYGTSEQFLQSFGLRSLSDLPPIGELKRRFQEKEEKAAEQARAAATAAPPAAPQAAENGESGAPQEAPSPQSESEANTPATPEPAAAAQSQTDEAPETPDGTTPGATDGAAEPEESIMTKREQWDDEDELEARQPDEDEDDEEFEDDEDEDYDDEDDLDDEDEDEDELGDEDDEDLDEDEDDELAEDELEDDEDEDYDDEEDEDEFDDEDEDEDEDEEEDEGPKRRKR